MHLERPHQLVETVRQPEYTGENRCFPCTIANLILVLGASVAVGIITVNLAEQIVLALALGGCLFVLSVVAIYLRGYVVPGTPMLTQRYAPGWFLELFDKRPSPVDVGDIDAEAVLLDAGVLNDSEDGGDLHLAEEFQTALRRRLAETDEQDATEGDTLDELLEALRVSEDVTITRYDHGVTVTLDGESESLWESETAISTDLATADVLEEFELQWSRLSPLNRVRLLRKVRMHLDRCPDCDARLEIDMVSESCCSIDMVPVLMCDSCSTRLFEFDHEVTE